MIQIGVESHCATARCHQSDARGAVRVVVWAVQYEVEETCDDSVAIDQEDICRQRKIKIWETSSHGNDMAEQINHERGQLVKHRHVSMFFRAEGSAKPNSGVTTERKLSATISANHATR